MRINFLSKDLTVLPPIPLILPGKATIGPSDYWINVKDKPGFPKAVPDDNGNFLYKPGTPAFAACEVYGILKSGKNLYEKILGRPIPYAFPGKVRLFPHDGEGLNAFYSRDTRGVHFLDLKNTKLNRIPQIKNGTLHMAESLDVGAHEEVGHCLLDGLKPNYLSFELETQAFHESFGDISSMILALHSDQVIEKLLIESEGNLRQSNVVSRLAQEAGEALEILTGKSDHPFLRDAADTIKNDWIYQEPHPGREWVPKDETKLGAEPHNFSRFFSGVWYEVFASLFESDPKCTTDPKGAVRNARDIAEDLIVRAAGDFAPETTGNFHEIAKAMIKADEADFQGKHKSLLQRIFLKRGLIGQRDLQPVHPPVMILAKMPATREEARAFLERNAKWIGFRDDHGLRPAFSKSNHPRFVYTNKKGETFLVYECSEPAKIDDPNRPELHGAEYKIHGSLKLGFNKKGELFHVAHDLIGDEKKRGLSENIKLCHSNDMIYRLEQELAQDEPRHFWKPLSEHHQVPYSAYTSIKDGKRILERVPVFSAS